MMFLLYLYSCSSSNNQILSSLCMNKAHCHVPSLVSLLIYAWTQNAFYEFVHYVCIMIQFFYEFLSPVNLNLLYLSQNWFLVSLILIFTNIIDFCTCIYVQVCTCNLSHLFNSMFMYQRLCTFSQSKFIVIID